jgi:hypothetical protein
MILFQQVHLILIIITYCENVFSCICFSSTIQDTNVYVFTVYAKVFFLRSISSYHKNIEEVVVVRT